MGDDCKRDCGYESAVCFEVIGSLEKEYGVWGWNSLFLGYDLCENMCYALWVYDCMSEL